MKHIRSNSATHFLRVLVVDDHYLIRGGLIKLLKSYSCVKYCHEADNRISALKALDESDYDIIFLDIDMPDMKGLETAKIIRRDYDTCRIVILSDDRKKNYLFECLELGINAFILKCYTEDKIRISLDKILKNQSSIPGEISEKYKLYKSANHKSDEFYSEANILLSTKEKRIILLICEQLTSDQISAKLGVSKTTVDTHRKRIFKKLKTLNSVGVVLYAIKTGLYSLQTI